MDRYHRQTLLPQIGIAGQARLLSSHVLLVGCGALGTVLADQLVRAGVGSLRIVDRDIVEWTNLQRQVLFDETDAADRAPKAVAAGRRLARVNSSVRVEPRVVDFYAGNAEELAGCVSEGRRADLILDGTDNVETRYLLNDLSVKHGIPWVYGACVGTEGRVMTIRPNVTACLRCVFPEPSSAGELPTCDTAGVLGPVAAVVGSMQSIAAIKLLTGQPEAVSEELTTLALWTGRLRQTSLVDARRENCPTCGRREFEFLNRIGGGSAVSLCGRDAMQIRPSRDSGFDLDAVARRLASGGVVERTPFLIRGTIDAGIGVKLTVFADGRAIIHGVRDADRAKSIYARWVGA